MARATLTGVTKLVQTTQEEEVVLAFIDTANVIVDTNLLSAGLTTTLLTQIENGTYRRDRNRDRSKPKPKKGFFEVANVEGEFLNFDGNFRYALSAVDDLEKAMAESGNYYSVEVYKRPLDIESDNRLSGDVGAGRGNRLVRAELGFRVVREIKQDG